MELIDPRADRPVHLRVHPVDGLVQRVDDGCPIPGLSPACQRFHGRYESRGISDPPTVSFLHHGTTVRVGLAPTIPGQPVNPRTRVVARFRRGIPFRLELAPAARPAPPQAPKGTRPVKTGDPEFDRVLRRPGQRRRDGPRLPESPGPLGGRQPAAAGAPRRHAGLDQPGAAPGPDRPQPRHNTEALIQAVSEALVIHDGLQVGVSAADDRGDLDRGQSRARPRMTAGPRLQGLRRGRSSGGPVILCTSCRTPHHRECWEYVGACSIYGCGSKLGEPEPADRRLMGGSTSRPHAPAGARPPEAARRLDHDRPVIRSTTRIAERTVAIVPWPGKTESPTTQRPGPRTSEPTARKLLLRPRDGRAADRPGGPPGVAARSSGAWRTRRGARAAGASGRARPRAASSRSR